MQWKARRSQVLCDAVALHTMPSTAPHREVELQATNLDIAEDLTGPVL